MKNLVIFSVLITLIFSCNSKGGLKTKEINLPKNPADSFVKDIPKWIQESEIYQLRNANLLEKLGLSSLQDGFDGTQIRIWIEHDLPDTQQGIIFTEHNSKWEGEFYYFKVHNDSKGELKSVDKRVERKNPKSGWKIFIDSLMATDIEKLPDHALIPGYRLVTDPLTITVEIATPKLYRFYQYPALQANVDKFPDAGKLEKALQLIEKEFDFRRLDNE